MRRPAGLLVVVLIAGTALLSAWSPPARSLWPPLVALTVILLTRRALVGLLAGAFAGAVLLAAGDPWQAYLALLRDHLAPSLASPWKTGAIAFTLILGGFAAVLDAGGGFTALLRRWAAPGRDAARRFQLAAVGLGLLCFFDGLANSMMVGRVGRRLADRCGVSRVKLAYIVDSTSSAVACVALVSTWIAFQLSMIESAFAAAGQSVNPYAVFLRSLPYNFHCWFTLLLVGLAAWWPFAPGPMRAYETAARRTRGELEAVEPVRAVGRPTAVSALLPLAVLLVAFLLGFLLLGGDGPVWPPTRASLVAAFGSDAGPLVMVLAGLAATVAAILVFPPRPDGRWTAGAAAFGQGMGAMVAPVFILLAAWMLGSVVQALGTAELLARLATRADALWLLPTATFLTGAAVSFATGTSWGTMGLLFPLMVPAAAAASGQLEPAAQAKLLQIVVAAVFSGAVFGDHCSPFSDTTIVTSIACEVEPHDHVRTQLPYALITALVAVAAGFLPAGLGLPAWASLLLGTVALVVLVRSRTLAASPRPGPAGPAPPGGL